METNWEWMSRDNNLLSAEHIVTKIVRERQGTQSEFNIMKPKFSIRNFLRTRPVSISNYITETDLLLY